MTNLAALSRLIRLPLSAMVALSALTGALAADRHLPMLSLWALVWGVWLDVGEGLTSSRVLVKQVE